MRLQVWQHILKIAEWQISTLGVGGRAIAAYQLEPGVRHVGIRDISTTKVIEHVRKHITAVTIYIIADSYATIALALDIDFNIPNCSFNVNGTMSRTPRGIRVGTNG